MSDSFVRERARDDFNRARNLEGFSKIFKILKPEKRYLLSFDEVKDLLKPKNETYKGMRSVPLSKIVGSEGRYLDFNNSYLPRHSHTRSRWENIDQAHLKDIILPPVKLYEIGRVYFVRDGNHRVSVAKLQGVLDIDAEVIELSSEIHIDPKMTTADLRKQVIQYEKDRVFNETELCEIISRDDLNFTETGLYRIILKHIEVHKYFLNENQEEEIPFVEAGKSWYQNLYLPIVELIIQEGLTSRFPGRTPSDLYIWIINHWDGLKKQYGQAVNIQFATTDYANTFGKGFFKRVSDCFLKIVRVFRELFKS